MDSYMTTASFPSQKAKVAHRAYQEWSTYMTDMYQEKRQMIEGAEKSKDPSEIGENSMDLLGESSIITPRYKAVADA